MKTVKIFMFMVALLISSTIFGQTKYELYKDYYREMGYTIGLENYYNLAEGQSDYDNVKMHANIHYAIVACSNDPDVSDVDVFLHYQNNVLFMKDADSSALAIISFNCYDEYSMKLSIKNYASSTPLYRSTIRYFVAYKYL